MSDAASVVEIARSALSYAEPGSRMAQVSRAYLALLDSWHELRKLLGQTECVYVHDEAGEMIAMVLPRGGWWMEQLPEAPRDHFGHEHIFPWGEPE